MTGGTEWIDASPIGGRLRSSDEYVVLEDHWIPKVIEFEGGGDGDPYVYARVEVGAAGPKLVELRFLSTDPDARGVRQADLRATQVSALLDLAAVYTIRIERDEDGAVARAVTSHGAAFAEHLRFVGGMGPGRPRDITPQLLERVAKLYRDNIAGYPTKAVEHHFQVSQRTAAEYVSRARKRGLLPPTKKGKKQA